MNVIFFLIEPNFERTGLNVFENCRYHKLYGDGYGKRAKKDEEKLNKISITVYEKKGRIK